MANNHKETGSTRETPETPERSPRQASSPGLTRPFQPRARERSDDANAFFPDPGEGPAHAPEDLSESLAEDFVEAATTGEDADEQQLDATFPEEIGGPFVITGQEEMAAGGDPANSPEAEAEPQPRAVAGLVTDPTVEDHLDDALDAAADDEELEPGQPEPPEQQPDADALNQTTRGGRRPS